MIQFGAHWIQNPHIAKAGEAGKQAREILDTLMTSEPGRAVRRETSQCIVINELFGKDKKGADVVILKASLKNEKTRKRDAKTTGTVQHRIGWKLSDLADFTQTGSLPAGFERFAEGVRRMNQAFENSNPGLKC